MFRGRRSDTTRALASVAGLVVASWAASAPALTQPNGAPIPVGSSLQNLFASRGEAINALKDAATTPETFTPSCGLTFQVLQRNAANKNSFGWYNVTGKKPVPSELHEFLSCNDPVGAKKVLDIKKDPAYLGGTIGFYQAAGYCATPTSNTAIFFSEKKYNPDGNQANPFIHLLIFNSTATPKAFYFGWEDLVSGGDNDFDDLTTFVSGISCSGGGGLCQTGKLGICATGTNQCQSGKLSCVPVAAPTTEACDGFDNDCNGAVDDGEICPSGQVCDNGACVPKCGASEFKCPAGKVCKDDKGVCVEPACLGATCAEGTRCVGGSCVDPCVGATCPAGQACIAGNCMDPCAAITCDESQVCQAGACVDKCQCAGCDATSTCEPTGLCLAAACAGKTCPTGQHCASDGSCVDGCAGVVCPTGQTCMEAKCVPESTGSGGTANDGGLGIGGLSLGGASGGTAGSRGSPAAGSGGNVAGTSGGVTPAAADSSCSCGAVGRRPRSAWVWFALGLSLAALGAGVRRRRDLPLRRTDLETISDGRDPPRPRLGDAALLIAPRSRATREPS